MANSTTEAAFMQGLRHGKAGQSCDPWDWADPSDNSECAEVKAYRNGYDKGFAMSQDLLGAAF